MNLCFFLFLRFPASRWDNNLAQIEEVPPNRLGRAKTTVDNSYCQASVAFSWFDLNTCPTLYYCPTRTNNIQRNTCYTPNSNCRWISCSRLYPRLWPHKLCALDLRCNWTPNVSKALLRFSLFLFFEGTSWGYLSNNIHRIGTCSSLTTTRTFISQSATPVYILLCKNENHFFLSSFVRNVLKWRYILRILDPDVGYSRALPKKAKKKIHLSV